MGFTVKDDGSIVFEQAAGRSERAMRRMRQSADREMGGLTRTLKGYWAELTALGIAFNRAWDAMNLAAKAKQEEQAFVNLAASYGDSADRILDELKRVSAGTISTVELVKKAGTAMMMGIDPGTIISLMEIARATTRQTGQTVTEAFGDISLGVARQSKMILDNLGIIVQVEKANKEYAAALGKTAGELTDAERKQAFLNATIRGGTELMQRMGPLVQTQAEQYMQYAASIDNAKIVLGEGLNRVLQITVGLFSTVGAVINGLVGGMLGVLGDLVRGVDLLASKIPGVDRPLAGLADTLQGWSEQVIHASDIGLDYAGVNFKLAASFGAVTPTVQINTKALGQNADAAEADAKALEQLNKMLQKYDDIINTAGLSDYRKKQYEINMEYDRQIEQIKKLAKDQTAYNAAVAKANDARRIELLKLERQEAEKAYEAWVKLNEERAKGLEGFVNKMLENDIELTDELMAQYEQYDEWERNAFEQNILDKKKQQDEYQKEYERQLKERQEAEQESFESTRSFFREMLSGMADDAGSFFDIIKAKLKNVAATIAADTLASIAMSVFRGVGSLAGAGGQGGLMSVFGLGGFGGAGSGTSYLNLIGGGKTLYGTFPGGMTVGGYNLYGPNTALPASMGGGPLPAGAEAINWLGAGAGALGMGFGGYGMYNAYRQGSPGWGAVGGAGAGLGAVTLAASGALGSAAAGAVTGSVFAPVIGTIIGAIVGAIIGAFGMAGAQAERERARRAEEYAKEFERAANYDVAQGSLADYMGGAESMLDKKSLYSFMKLGGISAEGSGELYRMIDFARQYKEAIEESGEASVRTIGNYQKLTTEMKWFNATAVAWSGSAKGIAEGFRKIQENIKALQLKAVMEDLNAGVGVFTYNMQKLIEIGLEGDELTKAQYEQTLRFLTTDAYPALTGELTKARAQFKAAAEEMEHINNAEEEAAIKTAILRSELNLTEQQLEALRTGQVNTEMIELYQALGWTDRELILVNADAAETVSIFKAMQEAGESMLGTLDSLKQQFDNVDVSDNLRKTYTALYQTATAVEILGEAGQKVEALPDTIEAMVAAAKNGDLTAFNTELMKTADTLLYLSGVADMANLSKIAAALGAGGQWAAGLSLFIELLQMAGKGAEWLLEIFYTTPKGKTVIDYLIDQMRDAGDIAQWLADQIEKALPPPQNVTGTIADIMNSGMGTSGAGSLFQQYAEALKYQGMGAGTAQVQSIQDNANAAIAAIKEQYNIEQIQFKALHDIALTPEELQTLQMFAEIEETIAAGAALATENLKKQWAEENKQIMQPIWDVIATAGMTDYQKAQYNITQQIQDQQQQIQDMYDSGKIDYETYLADMWDLAGEQQILFAQLAVQERKRLETQRQVYKAIYETEGMNTYEKSIYDIMQWQREQLEEFPELADDINRATATKLRGVQEQWTDFWDGIITSIQDARSGLEFSGFNLTPGKGRAASAAGRYEELKQALLAAQGQEAFQSAYQNFAGFYQTYLQEMQNTYASSSTYLAAYADVQSVLSQAQQRAEAESLALDKQDETILALQSIKEIQQAQKELQESNVYDFQAYKRAAESYQIAAQGSMSDISAHNATLVELASQRNNILSEISSKLSAIAANTAATASSRSGGSSSRSEPITIKVIDSSKGTTPQRLSVA